MSEPQLNYYHNELDLLSQRALAFINHSKGNTPITAKHYKDDSCALTLMIVDVNKKSGEYAYSQAW